MEFADLGLRGQSMLGVFAFIGIAWLLSERKKAFPFANAAWAIILQFAIAFLLLRNPQAAGVLEQLNGVVTSLEQATRVGTDFLFGYLGRSDNMPFEVDGENPNLFVFTFQALPLVVFISALSALLWHWRILKVLVKGFAFALSRIFGVGGAVSLAAAANVFLGQTESPLLIRAYLERVTRSELFTIITSGYATVAGSVIIIYSTTLDNIAPSILGHIIVASIISVPAALLLGKVMVPPQPDEVATPSDAGDGLKYESSMDAFMNGVTEGGKLWANIVISILAFIALAALINIMLDSFLPDVGGAPLSLERMFGWLFAPLMWLAGVPWSEAFHAGQIMGVKTAINELVAYFQLAGIEDGVLSDRTKLILVYSLCGFANIGSLGIVIGGLSGLVPSRRQDVIALAPKALVAGTLTTLMTGAVIGVIYAT